jgi:very-short-patch-repair endonuclease
VRGIKMENTLTQVSKELRQRQTEAEKLLWFKLRDRQLDRAKFRRQHRIGSYVVDFTCLEKKLIIEIDGGQHNQTLTKENDEQRTQWLEAAGYQVVRFWNSDVLQNTEGVLEKIKGLLRQKCHPHLASPLKGEENESGKRGREVLR